MKFNRLLTGKEKISGEVVHGQVADEQTGLTQFLQVLHDREKIALISTFVNIEHPREGYHTS